MRLVALLVALLAPGVALAETADAGASGDAAPEAGDAAAQPVANEPPPIPPELLPRVEARLGVERVELGQVVPLTITVSTRPGDRVHLPRGLKLAPFELLERHRGADDADAASARGRDAATTVMELELICFEAGRFEVPPIELMVVLADGRTGTVTTAALPLEVTDPLANEPDPQPRADHALRPVLTTDRRALWVGGALGALLLAALAGMAIGRLRERRRPRPAAPPPPPRPPEEVALEKLEVAERSGWLEAGEIKQFHIAVSEAVREYLGGRYGFDSLELTTEELLVQLDAATLRGVTRADLESFLFETDLVKFAKWEPDVERSRALLAQAYHLVRRTTEAERGWVAPQPPRAPASASAGAPEKADGPARGGGDAA